MCIHSQSFICVLFEKTRTSRAYAITRENIMIKVKLQISVDKNNFKVGFGFTTDLIKNIQERMLRENESPFATNVTCMSNVTGSFPVRRRLMHKKSFSSSLFNKEQTLCSRF